MESNAILELKAKNEQLKQELRDRKWESGGRLQKSLEKKNMQLAVLRMVWCSGGCEGGIYDGDEITPEMVAWAAEYASRLLQWYVNHKGRKARAALPNKVYSGMPQTAMLTSQVAWQMANDEIKQAKQDIHDASVDC
jgi:hypothetical protein